MLAERVPPQPHLRPKGRRVSHLGMARTFAWIAVERIRHTKDSQGQILAGCRV